MRYVRWFWQQMGYIRFNVLARIVAGVAQVGFGLLLVWLCRRFIDYAVWQGDVVGEALILVFVLAASIVLRQTVYYLYNLADVRQQNGIRMRLFTLLLHRRLYATAESMHSGDISQRLERDIAAVSAVTADVVPRMAVTLVQLAGAFLLMRSMDATLAWSLLVLTPVVIVGAKWLSHRLRQMTLDIRRDESHIQMLVQESVEHETIVRAMESQALLERRMTEMHSQLGSNVMRRARFTLMVRLLMASTFGMGYLGAFIYGGMQLKEGVITFGVMTAFLQLVSQIQSPIMALMNMLPQIVHATASVDRIGEIEAMEQEKESGAELISTGKKLGVRLQNVVYSYPGNNKPTLENLTHDFVPGTTTAITGETGRGKTTLLRMVMGMIEPESGTVELYDESGNTICGEDMRRQITYVPQGNTLLSGTIRDNLIVANGEATEAELLNALHTAVADFVLTLPKGLDTEIGEHATRLSEGQAQRIAIARGLLRKAPVMLLDEVSASLDPATERALLDRLFAECSDRTIICVTHKAETASRCGEIFQLNLV